MKVDIQYNSAEKILKKANDILILAPIDVLDILQGNRGGERLIREQVRYLRIINKNVELESLFNISAVFKILRLFQNATKINIKFATGMIKKKKTSPFGSLLLPFITAIVELLLRIDPTLKKSCNEIKEKYDLIIVNFPIGAAIVKKLTNKPTIIIEHNIEYIFLEEKLRIFGIPNRIVSTISRVYKWIEFYNLKHVDFIFCVSPQDREMLAQSIEDRDVYVWVPIRKKRKLEISKEFKEKGKIVIGFIGSATTHNIDAVEKIIELSKRLSDTKFEFWIIGSVGNLFRGQKDEIPKNVKFLGFVQNLGSVLSRCDLFINPKFTSPTGIEIKMFDYLKIDTPVISTSLGARGFEELIGDKIFIADSMEDMVKVIQSLINSKS